MSYIDTAEQNLDTISGETTEDDIFAKINYLEQTKTAIKTAIINKGIVVSEADTFRSYASKIASISGGGELKAVYGKQQLNYTQGASVFTADSSGIYLACNLNINGEGSDQTLTSPITSTGELLFEHTVEKPTYSEPDRNYVATTKVFSLSAGDTITLSNGMTGTHITQAHAVFKLPVTPTKLTLNSEVCKIDYQIQGVQQVSLDSTKKYIALLVTAYGREYAYVSPAYAYDFASVVSSMFSTDPYACLTCAVISGADTAKFFFPSYYQYYSSGWIIYEIG